MTGAGKARTIVLTGTFDVRNYGDLLFPLIAEARLRPFGLRVVPASPTGRDTGWLDALPPRALHEALEGPCDGLLIGGGNIIHDRPVTLPDYVAAGVAEGAYPALWLGASLTMARRGLPVAWNAPGVPYDLDTGARAAAAPAIRAAAYLALRDQASVDFLGAGQVVPDTALGLSALWPRAGLMPEFRALTAGGPGPFVAIHVKERSLDEPLDQLAARLGAFRARTGRLPILIGIGACHGDDLVTAELAARMAGQCIDLARPPGLRAIAAAIAFADGYVGASLHGYVTAASYGVRGLIVGKPKLPKMQGFLAQIAREADEAAAWPEALDRMAARFDQPPPRVPPAALDALEAHWQAVVQALTAGACKPAARAVERDLAQS